jgi:hypothetical protein
MEMWLGNFNSIFSNADRSFGRCQVGFNRLPLRFFKPDGVDRPVSVGIFINNIIFNPNQQMKVVRHQTPRIRFGNGRYVFVVQPRKYS